MKSLKRLPEQPPASLTRVLESILGVATVACACAPKVWPTDLRKGLWEVTRAESELFRSEGAQYQASPVSSISLCWAGFLEVTTHSHHGGKSRFCIFPMKLEVYHIGKK